MNDEEIIERIINLNYREFGAEVGNDLKRIIIKKEQKEQQLQSNWNSLREWVQKHYDEYKNMEQDAMFEFSLMLDKLNELEGKDNIDNLNDEVEIIEEDKEIEKLEYKYINTYGNVSQHRKSEEPIIDKINELIDKVNSLEKEGNE